MSLNFYNSVRSMRATLDAGITTVRDAGGADVVITTVDPLSDIEALQDTSKIMLVMKGGDIVKDLRAVS